MLIDMFEHGRDRRARTFFESAVAYCLLPGVHDLLFERGLQCPMLVLGPFAEADQMLFQTEDWISKRPVLPVVRRTVTGGVVTAGMTLGPVGVKLYEGRTLAGPGAFGGPRGCGVDREEIVAVHAKSRHAVTQGAGGEWAVLASGKVLEGGDRPLVVYDVKNDGGLVHGGEGHGIVKVPFRAGAFANPGRGDVVLALVTGGHCPTHHLAKLGSHVPRNGEKIHFLEAV